MAQRGQLTFPKPFREKYALTTGTEFTIIDLGGVFVLSPRASRIDDLAEKIADELRARGETLESMLLALREEREESYAA
ncbi:MAG: AbrB/MazE/SpoVT family DNA-binding domain-containing protein [Chloroflexi bacterium]|nr:MAG: AbrB/MazE/SpoVT family DNA-binding domain-containing protein [Chloroflexota bacterium]